MLLLLFSAYDTENSLGGQWWLVRGYSGTERLIMVTPWSLNIAGPAQGTPVSVLAPGPFHTGPELAPDDSGLTGPQ